MADKLEIVDAVVSNYAKIAAWMNNATALVFEVAERVLVVGAAKYAAASLPAASPAKDTVTAVAEFLHAVVLFWLVTKLWAQSSSDYRTFHRAIIFKRRWARITYRIVTLLIVCGLAYWMNHAIRELLETSVGAFATPEAH